MHIYERSIEEKDDIQNVNWTYTQNTACRSAQKMYFLNFEEVLLKIVVRGLFSQQPNFEQSASHSPIVDKQRGRFCHLHCGADSLMRTQLGKIEQLAMTFKSALLLLLLFFFDHAAAESKKGPKILTPSCCTWIWIFFYPLFHVHPFLCILEHKILHERPSDRIRAVEYFFSTSGFQTCLNLFYSQGYW